MISLALAIAVKGEWDAERLMQDLRKAGIDAATEIHIACDPRHAPASAPAGLTVHPQANASLFDLWGLAITRTQSDWIAVIHAITRTQSDWIAVIHADALPAQGWFSAMQRATEGERWKDGYWGPVEPEFGPSDPRMVGYLTEYCQFHRPLDPDPKEIPGSNLVLPRERIEAAKDFSKTRLLRQGFSPRPVEDAVVLYARPYEFHAYCSRRFRHGRAYAATRAPRPSLLIAAPMTAALPLVRTARVLRHAWRHKQLRLASLRWLPEILIAEICWSAGEFAGYVTRRPGDASALD